MKHKLIGLHNRQIQFSVNDAVYLIKRKQVEEHLNLYWFMADLYNAILRKFKADPKWFEQFKVS